MAAGIGCTVLARTAGIILRNLAVRRPEELNSMLALARIREQQAQHQWCLALQQAELTKAKLLELQCYATDYQAGLGQAVNAGGLLNHKHFLSRLDQAVEQQGQVSQNTLRAVQISLKTWQERQQDLKALEHIQEQRYEIQAQERVRVEQRALDDFAIQSVLRR
jgi:flagellar FliJ protein